MTKFIMNVILAAVAIGFVACGPQNKMHTIKPANKVFVDEESREDTNTKDIRDFVKLNIRDQQTASGTTLAIPAAAAQTLASRIQSINIDEQKSPSLNLVIEGTDKKQYHVNFFDPQPSIASHVVVFSKNVAKQIVTQDGVAPTELPEEVPMNISAQVKLATKNKRSFMIVTITDGSSSTVSSVSFLMTTNKLAAFADTSDLSKQIAAMDLNSRVVQAYYGDASTLSDDNSDIPLLASPANQMRIQATDKKTGKTIILVSGTGMTSFLNTNGGLLSAKVLKTKNFNTDLAKKLNDASTVNIRIESAPLIAGEFNLEITQTPGASKIKMVVSDDVPSNVFANIQAQANKDISSQEPISLSPADADKPATQAPAPVNDKIFTNSFNNSKEQPAVAATAPSIAPVTDTSDSKNVDYWQDVKTSGASMLRAIGINL